MANGCVSTRVEQPPPPNPSLTPGRPVSSVTPSWTPVAPRPSEALTPTATQTRVPLSGFQQGISYASWWHGEYSGAASDETLSRLVQPMGVTWIALIVTCYQDVLDSTAIQCLTDTSTPTDADLAHVVQHAHNLGLQVMLKPHLDPADPDLSRVHIGFGDDAAWAAWFENYTKFITDYATLAEQLDVDYFVIGTELTGTSHMVDYWRAIVESVRQVYSGPITYAANWGGEEVSIAWWDAVDAIGIDAYYPLTQNDNPTVSELRTAWAPIISSLEQLSKKWDRPIILTEIGYQSTDGVNQAPWNSHTSGLTDLQEQADTYQAAIEVFSGHDWWKGVFWWVWTTNPAQGGPSDMGYSANNKPAEDILRSFYGASPRPTPTRTPDLVPDQNNQLVIYDDSLSTGWENWSWESEVDFIFSDTVANGNAAIKVSLNPWGALSLHNDGIDTSSYYWLEFFIYVGTDTQRQLIVYLNEQPDTELTYKANVADPRYIEQGAFVSEQWQRIRIPLAEMGASEMTVVRVNLKDNSGTGQQTFLIDEIRLVRAIPDSQ